jgi:hypothetical protein
VTHHSLWLFPSHVAWYSVKLRARDVVQIYQLSDQDLNLDDCESTVQGVEIPSEV